MPSASASTAEERRALDELMIRGLNAGIWAVRANNRTRAALTSLDLATFCTMNQPEQNALVRKLLQTYADGSWRCAMGVPHAKRPSSSVAR